MLNPLNRNASAVLDLYEDIFTSSSTGMMVCSRNGNCLEVNQAMSKLFGMKREQMLGQNINSWLLWNKSGLIEASRDVIDQNREKRQEITVTLPEGDTIVLDSHILPIKRAEHAYVLYVFNDISAQKKVEISLRKTEQRFKKFADSLPQVVFELDLQGNLIYSNLKGPEVTGYSLEEMEGGLNAFQMVVPEERDRLLGNITRIIQERIDTSNEYTIIKKDGTPFPAMISSQPVIENSSVVGFRGVLIDLTNRKKVEQEKALLEGQLRQAQKMEALGTLTGGIAHDFNNILAIILGNAELAMVDLGENHPVRHHIDQVRIASKRAKELIKRLLTFSRQGKTEKTPCLLQDLVKESLKTLQSTIPKTVTLEVDLQSRSKKESNNSSNIQADATQIHQLLLNLCVNSVQAMNEKGKLKISVETVVFNEGTNPRHLGIDHGTYECLTVSDTGSGIEPELVEKIFEPFFTTKEVDKGTGIGLSVVQGIVKNHDGHIHVESNIGKGTVIRVYFPVVSGTISEEKVVEDGSLPLGSERVLFVDDEEMVVSLSQSMLKQLGYTVTSFTRSDEALEQFSRTPHDFDLVITDQTMPIFSGSELAVRMLQIRPDIPIIICTGYSKKMDKIKAKHLGIRAFILKPFELSEVARLIRLVLDDHNKVMLQ